MSIVAPIGTPISVDKNPPHPERVDEHRTAINGTGGLKPQEAIGTNPVASDETQRPTEAVKTA